jgi:hypothetical protein
VSDIIVQSLKPNKPAKPVPLITSPLVLKVTGTYLQAAKSLNRHQKPRSSVSNSPADVPVTLACPRLTRVKKRVIDFCVSTGRIVETAPGKGIL